MNRLQRLLIKHEGMRLKPYEDVLTEDITIGVGRNLDSIGLSEDEVLYLLDNDIQRCDKELIMNFKWYPELCRARQDAMINLCFNLGITRLRTFKKALQAMSEKEWQVVRARLDREAERRRRESEMATCAGCGAQFRKTLEGEWVGRCRCSEEESDPS